MLEKNVDVVTAKWHANFHAARSFREAHGGASCNLNTEFPPDYEGEDVDWIEAARWLERQRELYRKQKLTNVRVRLLKEVLGVRLHRKKGKNRRNIHPEIQRQNAEFKRELERRQIKEL